MATAISLPIQKPRSRSNGAEQVRSLETGDHLTRAEFERRYAAMPHVKKAELIEGVVYVGSPVSLTEHALPHFNVIGWLNLYAIATPGVIGGDNGTIRLDRDNEPQPDAFLVIDPRAGGQARFDGKYVGGAPELIVEISASSASYDLHEKLRAYRRNEVREYLTWRVQDEEIDWRVWREGEYVLLEPDAEGVLHSEVFAGLALDAQALIEGDMARVAEVQRAALDSPEHKAFADALRARLAESN